MPAGHSAPGPRRSSPLSSSSSSSSSSSRASPVRWSRRGHTSTRRISDTMSRTRSSNSSRSVLQRAWKTCLGWSQRFTQYCLSLPPLYRALALLACAVGLILVILTIVYSHRFFAWLAPMAKSLRELRGGWLIVFGLIFVTAFPPVMGYSTANTIAGLVYGFPMGWPIVAVACTLGSLCAFLASRTVLSRYVDAMVGSDHRFVALGQVLRRDGILYLTAIRFCPLPYSLSNGFLATIPSITPLAFAISTALSTPKLLIHVFIGSRLAILVEQGDKMSAGDKAINYVSMATGGAVGLAVGLAIYRRTMARAAELAREEQGRDADDAEQGQGGYDDTDTTLLDPEDAATIMSDDDVSLWEVQGNHDWGAYNDDDDDDDNDDGTRDAKKHGRSTSGGSSTS